MAVTKKWHIDVNDKPAKCEATQRECPREHFGTKKEAESFIEERAAQEGNTHKSLKKEASKELKYSPSTSTMTIVPRRIPGLYHKKVTLNKAVKTVNEEWETVRNAEKVTDETLLQDYGLDPNDFEYKYMVSIDDSGDYLNINSIPEWDVTNVKDKLESSNIPYEFVEDEDEDTYDIYKGYYDEIDSTYAYDDASLEKIRIPLTDDQKNKISLFRRKTMIEPSVAIAQNENLPKWMFNTSHGVYRPYPTKHESGRLLTKLNTAKTYVDSYDKKKNALDKEKKRINEMETTINKLDDLYQKKKKDKAISDTLSETINQKMNQLQSAKQVYNKKAERLRPLSYYKEQVAACEGRYNDAVEDYKKKYAETVVQNLAKVYPHDDGRVRLAAAKEWIKKYPEILDPDYQFKIDGEDYGNFQDVAKRNNI